jgi:hypothetical protein
LKGFIVDKNIRQLKTYLLTDNTLKLLICGKAKIKDLPDDMKIVDTWIDRARQCFCILVEHNSFPLCNGGYEAINEVAELETIN